MSNPPAHRPPSPAQQEHWRKANAERDLFFAHLDLVLSHEQAILDCDDYFFIKPSFAIVGVYCNTQVNLGTLLLGWRSGRFIDRCPCGGKAYVYKFGGIFSVKGWSGFCKDCGGGSTRISDSTDVSTLYLRWDIVSSANRQFQSQVEEVEEYPTTMFSFGTPAMLPAIKSRKVIKSLVEVLTVEDLLAELKTGQIRPPTPKDKSLVSDYLVVDHMDRATPEQIPIRWMAPLS